MSGLDQPLAVTVVKPGETNEQLARRRYRAALDMGVEEPIARYMADPAGQYLGRPGEAEPEIVD